MASMSLVSTDLGLRYEAIVSNLRNCPDMVISDCQFYLAWYGLNLSGLL